MAHNRLRGSIRLCALALIAGSVPAPSALADDSDLGMRILSLLAPGVGGHWFSSGSADRALGSPKFAGGMTFWVKPAHRRGWRITGGFQEVTIKDHWQPFSGGNKVSLNGAALKISRAREGRYDLAPFVTVGVYYGEIDSYRLNMSANRIVPSIAFGVEKEVARYVRLSAGYRWTDKIGGIDTSGGFVKLSLFP